MSNTVPRIAVLVSGEGTNLQALIDATAAGEIKARICGVLSDRAAAHGLERARAAGIAAQHVEVRPTRTPQYDRAIGPWPGPIAVSSPIWDHAAWR